MIEICGVIHHGGRLGEPLACGHPKGHTGDHAWATLPTFNADGMTATEKSVQRFLRNFGEFGTITDGEYIDGLDKSFELDTKDVPGIR